MLPDMFSAGLNSSSMWGRSSARDRRQARPLRRWQLILVLRVMSVPLLFWGCGVCALAQPALQELERTLPPARTDADAADRRGAPREPAYLGLIADDGDGVRGVRVLEPVAAGPAAAADFRKGDLIVAAAGQPITDLDDLGEVIDGLAAGDRISFDVVRGSERICLTATLGRRPEGRKPPTSDDQADAAQPAAQVVHRRLFGVRAVAVDDATRQRLGLPDTRGALVAEVFPDSAAAKVEIPVDSVILTLDDAPIADPLDLARRVAAAGPGREVEIGYFWDGALRHKRVVLSGTSPLAQAPAAHEVAKPAADSPQLDALERRLDELNRRLERIEQLLERAMGTPGASPPADESSADESSAN